MGDRPARPAPKTSEPVSGKEVNPLDGYAGHFSLATAVEAHPAESLVQRLALNFSDHQEVLTDARVLLCGHIGALELVELGYPTRSQCGPNWQRARARKPPDALTPRALRRS